VGHRGDVKKACDAYLLMLTLEDRVWWSRGFSIILNRENSNDKKIEEGIFSYVHENLVYCKR
jgi:hypothetical protein